MRCRGGFARLGVLGLCAAALTGCAAEGPPRTATAPFAGNQGGAWEVVLPGGILGASAQEGFEVTRRDELLNDRTGEAPLDYADRPTLDGYRRLHLHERPDDVIYFRSWNERRW